MLAIDAGWIRANAELFRKKRVVVVNGAGISVSCGIPDFRSQSGIFNEIKETLKISGSDMFTYRFSVDRKSRKTYLRYMSRLKSMVENAEPSFTHEFLNMYADASRSFRMYTQNIDGLEEKAGLVPLKSSSTRLVYLHGNMKELGCLYCGHRTAFAEAERLAYERGEEIVCEECLRRNEKRRERRQSPVGVYHTTIVHYQQSHPEGAFISRMAELDRGCDLLIVMGTSLKVFGVTKLVKYFCRLDGVRGKRILVNLEGPSKEFGDLFDFFWKGDCDEFCRGVGGVVGLDPVIRSLRRLSISRREESAGCDFAVRDTVVRRARKMPKEKKFEKLFPAGMPTNTPKKEVAFVDENTGVEKEVQEYIDLLIRSSKKKQRKKKSNDVQPAETEDKEPRSVRAASVKICKPK